jgi:hypothetical protein
MRMRSRAGNMAFGVAVTRVTNPTEGHPPEPAELLLRQPDVVFLDLLAKKSSPFVLAFPILCAIDLPILAECRRERLCQ